MKREGRALTAGILCAGHLSSVSRQLTVKLPDSPTGGEELWWAFGLLEFESGLCRPPCL